VDLDEVAALHEGAHLIAVGAVRGDEGGDRHRAGVGEQLGDLADAADVLGAVLRGEAQVLVEPVADVVAVEDVGAHAALAEPLLEIDRDGRLARAGKARQPDRAALVAVQLLAVLARHRALVPDDVGRFLLRHGREVLADHPARSKGAMPHVDAR
jgi:hypothetical protein